MLTDFSVGILVGVFFAAFVLAVVLFKYGRRKKRKGTRNRNGNRAGSIKGLDEKVPLMESGELVPHYTAAEIKKEMFKKFAEYDKKLDQLQYEINAKSSTGDNASASEEHDNSHSKDDPVNTFLHGPVLDPETSMKADNNGTSIRNGASGSSDEILVQLPPETSIEADNYGTSIKNETIGSSDKIPAKLPQETSIEADNYGTSIKNETIGSSNKIQAKFTKKELFFVAFCYVVWNTFVDVVYDRLEPHKANFDPKSYCAITHTYDEHRRKSYRQNKTKKRKKITNKLIGEDIEVIRSKKEDINFYFFKEKKDYIQLYSETVIKEKNCEDPYILKMDHEESCEQSIIHIM